MAKQVIILEEKYAKVKDKEEDVVVEAVQVENKKYEIKKQFAGLHIDMILNKSRLLNKPPCEREKTVLTTYQVSPSTWNQRMACDYAFNHPHIRSRLERLMGSNLVRLTDRQYMLQLHKRILEDYVQSMNKRIAAREARELEREKDLVLAGKIPLSMAPKDMQHHPILLINDYCEELIADRRAKIKVPVVNIPERLYWDDTPDAPYALTISEGHLYRKATDWICVPPEVHLQYKEDEDIDRGYMFTADDYAKIHKYELPRIHRMARARNVESMYEYADEIVGPLKTIAETASVFDGSMGR